MVLLISVPAFTVAMLQPGLGMAAAGLDMAQRAANELICESAKRGQRYRACRPARGSRKAVAATSKKNSKAVACCDDIEGGRRT